MSIRKIARKSIVAKTKIKKGDIFSIENITAKRPGDGISPDNMEKLLGKREGMLWLFAPFYPLQLLNRGYAVVTTIT